jgi:hypothetical protein
MKTPIGYLILLASIPLLRAQTPAASGGTSASQDTPFAIVSQDGNTRVWERITYNEVVNGQAVPTKHRYVECCSGLNFWTGQNWKESREEIQIQPDGTSAAVAGQHQAYFPPDIYEGVIRLVAPDGKVLQSRPVGLSYDDGSNTVMIAELTNSVGVVNSNEVIYANAFSGFAVDLKFLYTRAGFEQFIILREQPPAPASLGLNPDTTRIQVLTEFFNPPQPAITTTAESTSAGDSTDDTLNFGAMQMVRGKAFLLGESSPDFAVNKQWIKLDQRQFLVEEIPTAIMGSELEQLPIPANQTKLSVPQPSIAKRLILPVQRIAKTKPAGKQMRMATTAAPEKGLVLDYNAVIGNNTNFTFQGDTTYFISGTVNLFGINTFEGGSVLKFATNASISVAAPATFKTTIYHPLVLDSKDNNTLGDTISGSTGNPSGYYANPALSFTGSGTQQLSNVKISYAQTAIASSAVALTVNNAQLVNCGAGISVQNHPLTVNNALFVNTGTNLVLNAVAGTVNNATFANANYLLGAPNTGSLYLTNSVLANVTNVSGTIAANYNGFYNTTTFGSNLKSTSTTPFIPVGGANCYLTNISSFIGGGTPGVGSGILAQLAARTTRAPLVYSNLTYSVPLSYAPVVTRDTNGTPDLGYHYDPVDIMFGGVVSYSNVTFAAGTAMGWFELNSGGNYGIALYDHAVLALNGTASQPCVVVRYSSVQEGGTGIWKTKGTLAAVTAESLSGGYSMPPANAAQVWPTFTKHYCLAFDNSAYRENTALLKVMANNSEFYTTPVGAYWAYLNITNCLFDRAQLNCVGGNAAQAAVRNCSFHGGSVSLTKSSAWPVWFEECAFDGTTLAVNGSSSDGTNVTYCDFNAYLTTATTWLPVVGTHSVTVTNFNWQASWLGTYYQPGNSLTINAGSQTADQFGLYHFTTQTNQAVEGFSPVDIGYHYVATDASGNPLDSNGDGIPDYLEDANGNGIYDSGDLANWLISPFNGLSTGNGLQIFTPLK